jgi:SAM-dependent methyltransferase
MKEHWNTIYASRKVSNLGWYETKATSSIDLLAKCKIDRADPILDVGAGASTFIDYLVGEGYTRIFAADISEIALAKLKDRLGSERTMKVKWIVDDITQPRIINNLRNIALWHDRAMLHFLLEPQQQQAYLSTLKKVTRKGGYVIIAAFSLKGVNQCSGLTVKNYDQNMLADFLGDEFRLLEFFDYLYQMPSGNTRPYIYTLFQRK